VVEEYQVASTDVSRFQRTREHFIEISVLVARMTIEELSAYGMERMDAEEIHQLLATKSLGVLGLPTTGAPSMRPMTFSFDGKSTIYFVYVLGSRSRKESLTSQADAARFLVYSVETMFNWRSVLLTGPLGEIPADERDRLEATIEVPWRPELFERATASETTALYQLEIEDRVGIKHIGLPSGFQTDASESPST
jgi:nitroimidazol reductase NimA-like FMN-containing flavoprotein (pyridoxamine 5'-phosphate oxidase superfamily)